MADESHACSLAEGRVSLRFVARQTLPVGDVGAEDIRVSSAQAAAEAAQTLSARREEVAHSWADLSLFANAYVSQRDEAASAATRLVEAMVELARSGRIDDYLSPGFTAVREVLSQVTSDRLRSGGDAQQVIDEIGQLQQPLTALFDRPPLNGHADTTTVPAALLAVTELIGSLRVAAVVALLGESDEVMARQRQELMEISTPVIRLWEGIVAVPLIGTLDSTRSQVVMESLLSGIVDEQAAVAILDITGVPMVDTLVAQHLMKTAMAVQLMGAECVISGIRPQIAQTIVHLGIDLREITTRATLSDALKYGLARTGVDLGSGG
jgi:rsbT co-antagonist protein RsbR